MDQVRRGFVVTAAVTVTVLAAGCSAGRPAHRSWQAPADEPLVGVPLGNQVDGLDPAAILQRAQAATAAAKSVHVKGELITPGKSGRAAKPFRIDMRFTSTGSEGTIVEDDTTSQTTRVQNQVWFRGDERFWSKVDDESSSFEADSVANHDKYVQVPTGDKAYAGIVENTYIERLTNKLIGKPGKLEKGATSQINGHRAIALEIRTSGSDGTIWVATEGAPVLLRLETAPGATRTGAFDFLGYGERTDVHAPEPKDVVDKDLGAPSRGSSSTRGSTSGSSGSGSSSGTGGSSSSSGSSRTTGGSSSTSGSSGSSSGSSSTSGSSGSSGTSGTSSAFGGSGNPPVPDDVEKDPLLFP